KYEKALLKLNNELNRYRKGGAFESMFPQRWLPVAVGILSEGFTEENRMINSTMKMVRPRITEQYKDLLDYLYSPDAKSITNKRNVIAMRSLIG
ncbi:MAG: long-chain fatty acid--CoA ligase, partial [Bacteroidales bacterium]